MSRENPKYLVYLRLLPCCGCGATHGIQAAHVRFLLVKRELKGGTSLKPDDRCAVSLCDNCHRLQHQIGEKSFWNQRRTHPETLVALLTGMYELFEKDLAVELSKNYILHILNVRHWPTPG